MTQDTSRVVAIVGRGRAGGSFADALETVGWTVAGRFGRGDDPGSIIDEAELVLLTVPDDAIAAVAARLRPGSGVLAHVSGAKGLDVLLPHRRRASIHPLVSLPDPTTGSARLRAGATFAVAGDPIASAVVTDLGGRPITVDDDQRSLYHATAAVAANHLVVLCAQVERLAAEVGVPIDAYWELMATTLGNVRRSGPLSSLTGPAARGDTSTLLAHLRSLPPDEHDLYVTLANRAAALAGSELAPGWDIEDR